MTDIASLGMEIKSSDASQATQRLNKFEASAGKAEQASKKLSKQSKRTATQMAGLSEEIRSSQSAIAAIDGPLGGIAGRFRSITSTVKDAGIVFGTGAVALAGLGFAAKSATDDFITFQSSLAEVSTLVDTTKWNMDDLKESIIEQSNEFGKSANDQAKATYQIISAGAKDAASATDLLVAADKLAVGGITSVYTAADGLTSIMNAYGDQVKSATDVSDTMFVAMRDGKTTIGELSASLGTVAPIAAQLGVSFDELAAVVAALTKAGMKTDEVITGVRAILSNTLTPTTNATKLAKSLGLEFNAAALKAEGFTTYLQKVMQATQGDASELGILYGNVRGLTQIMSLSGEAGKSYAQILEDMKNKAGATDTAVEKMENTFEEQWGRLTTALNNRAMEDLGSWVEDLTPDIKELADNFGDIADKAETLGTIFATVLVARGLNVAVSAMTGLITTQVEYISGASRAAAIDAELATSAANVAKADLAAAEATEARAAANVTALQRAAAVVEERETEVAITAELTAAETELAAAKRVTAAATTTATAAAVAETDAIAATGVAAKATAGFMTVMKGAMAFIGGPVGIAVTTLAVAFFNAKTNVDMMSEAIENAKGTNKEFQQATAALTGKLTDQNEVLLSNAKLMEQNNVTDLLKSYKNAVNNLPDLSVSDLPSGGWGASFADTSALSKINTDMSDLQNTGNVTTASVEKVRNEILKLQKTFPGVGDAALDQLKKLEQLANEYDVSQAKLAYLNGTATEAQKDLLQLSNALPTSAIDRMFSTLKSDVADLRKQFPVLNTDITQLIDNPKVSATSGVAAGLAKIKAEIANIKKVAPDAESRISKILAAPKQTATKKTQPGAKVTDATAIYSSELKQLNKQADSYETIGDDQSVISEQMKVQESIATKLRSANKGYSEEQINNLASLTDEQKTEIAQTVRAININKRMNQIWSNAVQPLQNYRDQLAAVNKALSENHISASQAALAQAQATQAYHSSSSAMQSAYGAADTYQTTLADLNNQLDQGNISLQSYNKQLRTAQESYLSSSPKFDFADAFNDQIAEMQLASQDAFTEMGQDAAQVFGPSGTLITGISDAVGKSIAFGDSFGDTLKNVAQTIESELISSLVKIGLNMVENAAIGDALAATSITSTTASAAAASAAWAPAAALASLATLGTNAEAATAAITGTLSVAEAVALSGISGFKDGVVDYSGDGTGTSDSNLVKISSGESVMTADATAKNKNMLQAMNAGASFSSAAAANNNQQTVVSPVFSMSIDARGAQEGVSDQIDAKLQDFAVSITKTINKQVMASAGTIYTQGKKHSRQR